MSVQDLSGLWKSKYTYHSSSRDGDFDSEHVMRLHQNGAKLIAETTPENSSYVLMKLTREGNVLSGSWQEQTEPGGHYKGAIYHGVLQMVVDSGGKHIRGKWAGFDSDGNVNTGPWELSRSE